MTEEETGEMANDSTGLSSPTLAGPSTMRGRSPRKVWLHFGTTSSSTSDSPHSPTAVRKRPEPLTNFELVDSKSHNSNNPSSSSSSVEASSRFPFISPVEPLVTLARFHRTLNKVYIPLEEEEELEIGEEGFRALNGGGSNFALLGTPGSSLLGEGAYGQVYKAIHFPTMRRVAIKKIPKDFGRTNDFTNSFARELRNLYSNVRKITDEVKSARAMQEGTGHCPFLLTLYDAYVERNPTNLCLVLEYMEGGSLEQMMTQNPGACQDESFVRELCHNVLKGLLYLHQRKFLHQDVKPGNILLTASKFAKLADFGLTVAVNAEEDAMGETYNEAVAVGTARYWPPELWGLEKKRDPEGKGDIWGLGLSIVSIIHGNEPLHSCTTRSQVEIELGEASKDALTGHVSSRQAAEARNIFSTEELEGFSPVLQDFVSQCLKDLPERPTAAELLQHGFIKGYCKRVGRRQRELDEAVKALKTHIQIHREWKVTPQMVDLLAKELRIKNSDLKAYLEEHLDPALVLTLDGSVSSPLALPSSTTSTSSFSASQARARCDDDTDDDAKAMTLTMGAGAAGREEATGGEHDDEQEEEEVQDEEIEAEEDEDDEDGEAELQGEKSVFVFLDAPTVMMTDKKKANKREDDSLQVNFLSHYDELDRLRTEVIPPLEDLIKELKQQLCEKDMKLATADQEIENLRQQLISATMGLATP